MFNVYDNNKPASKHGFKWATDRNGWGNHSFKTFEEAHDHAIKWLGEYGEGVILKLNEPYNYNSFGEAEDEKYWIEIREE